MKAGVVSGVGIPGEQSDGTTGIKLDIERDTQRLVALVEDAAISRGAAVSAVMFHLAAVRSLQSTKAYGENAGVQCVAARVQNRRGADS